MVSCCANRTVPLWRSRDLDPGYCLSVQVRQNTVSALQVAINLGMDAEFRIHAPLMYLTKKESIDLMVSLGHLDKLALSQTCYNGQRPPCNACPACELRAKGFEEAGVTDPLQEIEK